MNNLVQWVQSNRLTAGLIAGVVIILLAGGFFFKNYLGNKQQALGEEMPEIDLSFEADGPYAIISPRRDGNALILNIKRVASYSSISYELAYTSEGIDRGVVGKMDTNQQKGEYEQEILFGTCSKNVCKYDTGVENGTLTLHIKKGNQPYRMLVQWHLQKPDVALGALTSGDNHFQYKIASGSGAATADLAQIGFTITNELTGVPKLPDNKKIAGKVYALNGPLAKVIPAGDVRVELADNPGDGAVIARYDDNKNSWTNLDTKAQGSTLTAHSDQGGVFAVLVNSK